MSADVGIGALRGLENVPEIELGLLIRKNGDIVASVGDLVGYNLESFGIMTATIYGAANTANEHLDKKEASRIVIRGSDGDTLVKNVDSKNILVIRTKKSHDFKKILIAMDRTIEQIILGNKR